MKIAIIGAGRIGSTLARLLLEGGQTVMLAATSRESAETAASKLPGARSGEVEEAVAFGEALIVAVPLKAWPDLARDHGAALSGKVVIDTSNIAPDRDGEVADAATRMGEGSAAYIRSLLPAEVRLAKAFNTLWSVTLGQEARRPGPPVAVPIAADDPEALRLTGEVVRAAGYTPVQAGGLEAVRRFDAGTPAYNKALTEPELREALARGPA